MHGLCCVPWCRPFSAGKNNFHLRRFWSMDLFSSLYYDSSLTNECLHFTLINISAFYVIFFYLCSVSHKMNAMMYKIELILALWHDCFFKTIFTSQGGNLQSSSPYGSPARSPSPYRGTGIHSLISSASVPRKLFWFFLFLSVSVFLFFFWNNIITEHVRCECLTYFMSSIKDYLYLYYLTLTLFLERLVSDWGWNSPSWGEICWISSSSPNGNA